MTSSFVREGFPKLGYRVTALDGVLFYKDILSGPFLKIKTVFHRYGIPMLKIRRSRIRLILNIGIHIRVRRHLYMETPSGFENICINLIKAALS